MGTRRLNIVLDLDTGQYSGRLTTAGAQMKAFGGHVDSSSKSVRSFSDSVGRMGGSMSTPLQKLRDYVLVMGNLRLAFMNMRDLSIGWIAGLLKQSAEVERLTVLMKGLSNQTTEFGKNAEAKRNLGELMTMARNTGFELGTLTDAFVKFRSAKLNPSDGSLQALSDAVASFGGTSETMHRASIAIQQMAGKGVISMEELRQQLGEAVPNAMELMARSMGLTMRELTKQVSQGAVQAAPALKLMFDEMQRTFSGSAEKLADTFNGQLAQVRTNVMLLATQFTGLGDKEGLFSTSVNSLKQFNEILRSSEGAQTVQGIGRAVDHVAVGLLQAAKVAIQFRDEIGGAIKAIAYGVIGLTAIRFASWIKTNLSEAAEAFRALGAGFKQASAEFAAFQQALSGNVTAQNFWVIQNNAAARLIETIKANVAAEKTLIDVTQQRQGSLRTEISMLQNKAQAMRDNLPLIQQSLNASKRELSAAQTLHAANVSMGRDSTTSAERVATAEQLVNQQTQALTRTRLGLKQVTRDLVTAEAELAAAENAETAATERMSIAAAQNTLATRAMSVATTLAAGATRALSGVMALAANPIVMVGLVLYQAASAAGLFESNADKAAQAAVRLAAGIGSVADAESVAAQRKRIQQEIKDNQPTNELFGVSIEHGDKWYNSGLNVRTNDGRKKRILELQAEDADLAKKIQQGKAPQAQAEATKQWEELDRQRSIAMAKLANSYRDDADKLSKAQNETNDKGAIAAIKAQQKARIDAYNQAMLANDKATYETTKRQLEAAKAAGKGKEVIDALAMNVDRAGKNVEQTNSMIKASAENAALALGAGAKGLDKWGRAAAMADAKAAGLEAKLHGAGSAMAEFNKKLSGGLFNGATPEQIDKIRGAAVATDALAAAHHAAAADTKYENRLISIAGKLAELQARLSDGKGELAKFNAELAADPKGHLGLTPTQIQNLRAAYGHLDGKEKDIDTKKVMDGLNDELAKAKTSGDELWSSFADGTLKAERHLDQIKARFADKLIGLSGTDLDNAQKKINDIADSIARADAVSTAQNWKDQAAEITNALMTENQAREANYQLELARQKSLLDVILGNEKLKSDEKRRAEESFLAWKNAAEMRNARQAEGALAQQARSWANLGQNIQQTMAQALQSVVEGMMGANQSFSKLIVDILKKIMTVILEAMIAYAILSAIGMANNSAGEHVSMGSFLKGQMAGGLGGAPNTSSQIGFKAGGSMTQPAIGGIPTSTALAGLYHSGGRLGSPKMTAAVDPSVFDKARRFHSGGTLGGQPLKKGEVPFIGLEDEVILNQDQQRILGQRLGGGGQQMPNVEVNVINNSGTQLDADHGKPEFNGKDMILSVVVEAAQKQGRLRDTIQQIASNK